MVVNPILGFKTQAVAEGHVGSYFPVIFTVDSSVNKGVLDQRIAGDDDQLPWLSTLKRGERIESIGAVKILGREVRVGRGPQPATQA